MNDVSLAFIELGIAILSLALLTYLSGRWGFSAIPLYLLVGLAFGNGGILPLQFSEEFVHIGAEIGVLLLLFMLGLEYTGESLQASLRSGLPAGLIDLLLNFPPGLLLGLWLGWHPLAAFLLGGVTYISSSGVIAKVLEELGHLPDSQTSLIISILVLEDLAMAVYLPLVGVLLIGQSLGEAAASMLVALATVGAVLFIAIRFGKRLSSLIASQSDEVILFTIFGLILLVAGLTERLQISAAIGAFLIGIAVSGPITERTHRLIRPSRDLFAAIFFLFFGLQIDPASLPPVLLLAAGLGFVSAATKIATGWWATQRLGTDGPRAFRTGAVLVAHGEFSIVIAGLGAAAGIEPQLGPLSAAYVLFLAVLGPLLARVGEPLASVFGKQVIDDR